MLTEQELSKIFSWLPYRSDWPVDRNQSEENDNINKYFGNLIHRLTKNSLFDCYYSENGGMSNYLEFICYPRAQDEYHGNSILVCVSLCAPIAAYGQTGVSKTNDFFGWMGMFAAADVCKITDESLFEMENEIRNILEENNLLLLDEEFACTRLPEDVAAALLYENHNEGNQHLHGIFQKTD